MGLFDALMGNAGEVNLADLEKELSHLLINGENITKGFKLVRDFFLFTNKRVLIVDKQGLTGSKVSYHSIPYKSITQFSLETAGTFDMDAELKIWISGVSTPVEQKLSKGSDIVGLQRELAEHVL